MIVDLPDFAMPDVRSAGGGRGGPRVSGRRSQGAEPRRGRAGARARANNLERGLPVVVVARLVVEATEVAVAVALRVGGEPLVVEDLVERRRRQAVLVDVPQRLGAVQQRDVRVVLVKVLEGGVVVRRNAVVLGALVALDEDALAAVLEDGLVLLLLSNFKEDHGADVEEAVVVGKEIAPRVELRKPNLPRVLGEELDHARRQRVGPRRVRHVDRKAPLHGHGARDELENGAHLLPRVGRNAVRVQALLVDAVLVKAEALCAHRV